MKEIQWYPGHMTKARRMMEESLRQIDVIVELVDARAPIASRNPDFDHLFAQKQRIVVLNKADLADTASTREWEAFFAQKGAEALSFVATRRGQKPAALKAIERASAEKVAKMAAKGVKKTVRVMIAGIPNVGKSTFINTLSGGANATTGNRPGVTKGKQWVRLGPYLELMDTPGMLWPKLENRQEALHLAYIGAIRDGILDTEELALSLLENGMQRWPEAFMMRYPGLSPSMSGAQMLETMGSDRGFLLQGGVIDLARAASTVLDEFRRGVIGRFTLDDPKEQYNIKDE